jgi:dienelactone hydrolase
VYKPSAQFGSARKKAAKERPMSMAGAARAFTSAMFFVGLCTGQSVRGVAQQPSVPPAEMVQIPVHPLPFDLQGFLRHPEQKSRLPAVVLLPACGRYVRQLDENWGARISSWGYVTLTIDGFGPRGIKHCGSGADADSADLAFDGYRGLNFLIQTGLVDPKRIAIVGFAAGAWQTFSAIERGAIEQAATHKFRSGAAFYPFCRPFKGIMTVPTLILIGGRDDWASADACRKMAAGEDDTGISRQKGEGAPVRLVVYPDAYFGFDLPILKTPMQSRGHRAEFNQSAADQSSEALREFLHSTIGGGQ